MKENSGDEESEDCNKKCVGHYPTEYIGTIEH